MRGADPDLVANKLFAMVKRFQDSWFSVFMLKYQV